MIKSRRDVSEEKLKPWSRPKNLENMRAAEPADKSPRKRKRKPFSWVKKIKFKEVAITAIQLTINPKTTVMNQLKKWLASRGKEPSTYQGLTVLLGILGWSVSPEMIEEIIAIVTGVIGLIHLVKRDHGKELNDKVNKEIES